MRDLRPLAWLGLLWLAAAHPMPKGATVTLTAQPGSALEQVARELVAADLAQARKAGETPVMLVGSARLSTASGPAALFVQVQSASFCGSAGCTTDVYVGHRGTWRKVLDSISGPIKLSTRTHLGMHDLLVHGSDRFVWDGRMYRDTLPAPEMDLLRRGG